MKKGQAFFLAGAIALGVGACSGTPREATLTAILDRANAHEEISEVLADLPLSGGVSLGALVSHSAQSSEGRRANPRLILELSDGTFVTTLLDGDSLELGLPNRRATDALPVRLRDAVGDLSTEKGELLVEMHPFPRHGHRFTAHEVVNRWDGLRDTHGCTGCHVDVSVTKGPYGSLPVKVGDEIVSALVSPTSFDDISSEALCVPGDLRMLQRCGCEGSEEAGCAAYGVLRAEACRRLAAVLAMNPRQSPRYAAGCGEESPRRSP